MARPPPRFYGVLEPHGQYDGTAETVRGANSRIDAHRRITAGKDADVLVLDLAGGKRVALGIADDPAPGDAHEVSGDGQSWRWDGGWKRFDSGTGKDSK